MSIDEARKGVFLITEQCDGKSCVISFSFFFFSLSVQSVMSYRVTSLSVWDKMKQIVLSDLPQQRDNEIGIIYNSYFIIPFYEAQKWAVQD